MPTQQKIGGQKGNREREAKRITLISSWPLLVCGFLNAYNTQAAKQHIIVIMRKAATTPPTGDAYSAGVCTGYLIFDTCVDSGSTVKIKIYIYLLKSIWYLKKSNEIYLLRGQFHKLRHTLKLKFLFIIYVLFIYGSG